jgi:DNA-binding SARP family transcriptional activator/Tfp pilus assembly protein PilF
MQFCLLGPLVVRHSGVEVPVAAGKQRAVLAALLLDANRVVAVDELAEALWGPGPPVSARVGVQNYVMRLRKALDGGGRELICTRPGGYLISLGPDELDVAQFGVLLGAARAAAQAGSWDSAAGQARAALSLWRGEPLADVASEYLALREVPRLAEMQLQALDTRIDADLQLGRHAEVIAELRQLAGAYPLREHLHAMLMLALFRDGRQAEAFAAYQHARRVLVEEIGAEPGPGLRELHQRMLSADPALALPAARGRPGSGPGPVVPRQLPSAVAHFAGRTSELAALSGLLNEGGHGPPGAVVISAIAGTPGVGKTALAVHWAHQVAERFPDGQLYVNLRGYDPAQPVTAAETLAGFLRALGVSGKDIPAEENERAARYRSLLAGRQMLVLLDNAGEEAQVRPLLPGSSACVVIVTSRDALAGLVARDGAKRLDLDLLSPDDAVGLLRALIGGRVDADPEAAVALAAQCARLPLALRIAAELAAARPDVTLADLAAELADQQKRLDLLTAGEDRRTAIRAVFSWSYLRLDRQAARAFRLLGLHPGTDWDRYAVAALTGSGIEQADHMISLLSRGHLIHTAMPGRYGMHDLLRAYAAEEVADNGEEERRAALTGLFGYYLHTAAAAMDTLFPAERDRRPRIPPAATPAPPVGRPAEARAWLNAELANLVDLAAYGADHGWPCYTTRLAQTLFRHLNAGDRYPEAVTIHTHARRAAQHTKDRIAEARALNALGLVDLLQGRYRRATDYIQQALALNRETTDRAGEARALTNLGNIDLLQGHYRHATGYFQQALAVYRDTSDRVGEVGTLGNLGFIDQRQGHLEQAMGHLQQALAMSRETGDRAGEAHSQVTLGLVDLRRGRYQRATSHLRQGLAQFRETGDRSGEAYALAYLGLVCLREGDYQQAACHYRQALALFREFEDRSGEAEALNGLGEAFFATGQPARARDQHAVALSLASKIADQDQQARAHCGLARTCQITCTSAETRHHWQAALTIYTGLGVPEAAQVRAELAAANDQDHRPREQQSRP